MSQAAREDTTGDRERALCALVERMRAIQVEHARNAVQLLRTLNESDAVLCGSVQERAVTLADLKQTNKFEPRDAPESSIPLETAHEDTAGDRERALCNLDARLKELETAQANRIAQAAQTDRAIEAIMHDAMQLRAEHAVTSAAMRAELAEIEQSILAMFGLRATVASGAS